MEIAKKLDALCISQNAYNAERTDVISKEDVPT